MAQLIFLTHLAATLFLVGLIWFVQIVHYPLFERVGRAEFTAYETAHTRLTLWMVAPLMLVEAGTALLLIFWRPATVLAWQVWLGAGLVLLIWLSTAFLQVPQHSQLRFGFEARAHRFLVASNWLRTGAWSLRGLLVLEMVAGILEVV